MNDIALPPLLTSSSRMIEFLLSLTLDKLPAKVISEARIRLLDSLGCGLYGAMTPWGRITAQVAYEEKSRGLATIYGGREPVAPARAALVNGTATHGFELDDLVPGGVHPGAIVVPAALVTAEHFELSGARLVLGLIAGYEAASRAGLGIGEVSWGFHKTGIAGVVGSAVGSGVALGLSHEQLLRAIGIACSSAAGIKSFVQGSGGMIKRMHAGRAAESGVLACLLARRGFTAPLAALDGKFGLLDVYGGDHANPQALDRQLGESYAVSEAQTKAYPFCYGLHTMAQALYSLRDQHRIAPADIKSVRIGTNKRAVTTHAEVSPKETMAAQYSMPFVAGVALAAEPKDPRSFIGNALDDPAVCAVARRVELYNDPEMDAVKKAASYPRHGAYVELHLNDGKRVSAKVLDARGTPGNPCGDDEIKQKFRMLASASHTDDAVAEILALVERIETLPSVAPLSRILRAGIRD